MWGIRQGSPCKRAVMQGFYYSIIIWITAEFIIKLYEHQAVVKKNQNKIKYGLPFNSKTQCAILYLQYY